VRRHRAVVLRLAARVVGHDEADDVAQHAFLRAFTGSTASAARRPSRLIAEQRLHAALSAARRRDVAPLESLGDQNTDVTDDARR
jgi:DNA-directed RNA polymerase specialized sigma24 family protein